MAFPVATSASSWQSVREGVETPHGECQLIPGNSWVPRVWVAPSYSATQQSQDPALQGVQLWLLGYLTLCGPELPPLPTIISTYALLEVGLNP